MPGKEDDPTNKEGLVNESSKGLPSDSHESSQQKTPGEDKRGDLFMAKPALKERAAKKEKQKKDTSEAPPSQIQEEAKLKELKFNPNEPVVVTVDDPSKLPEDFEPKQSSFVTAVFQSVAFRAENQILRTEVERLQEENEELAEKVERRLQQSRDSYEKQRQENPDEYKAKKREYMRKYRERKKKQA